MSISEGKRHFIKATAFCSAVTALLIIFGIIYDKFGRGVHSRYITHAFLFVFALCVIPYSIMALFENPVRSRAAFNLCNAGVATMTSASIVRGVVRVAGTGSKFEIPTFIAGAVIFAVGFVIYLIAFCKRLKEK